MPDDNVIKAAIDFSRTNHSMVYRIPIADALDKASLGGTSPNIDRVITYIQNRAVEAGISLGDAQNDVLGMLQDVSANPDNYQDLIESFGSNTKEPASSRTSQRTFLP